MENKTTIAGIMTAGRLEFTYARNIIERAMREMGIPLRISSGVFYGQCMQKMLEDLLNIGGIDYAVTVDFDTLFSARQLQRLINWIHNTPEIDAITGMQVRRGKPVMLGTVPGGTMVDADTKQIQWDGKPVLATTAHFGLTVIDLKKLERVAKPWFHAIPDSNGSWEGEDKIDDDVAFWLKWKEAGNSIYIDPGVRLGHLEEMVAIHDENAVATHVYPSEWEKFAYAPAAH